MNALEEVLKETDKNEVKGEESQNESEKEIQEKTTSDVINKSKELGDHINLLLDSLLNASNTIKQEDLKNNMESLESLESIFQQLDLLVEDFSRENVKNLDKITRWKKNYNPTKGHF